MPREFFYVIVVCLHPPPPPPPPHERKRKPRVTSFTRLPRDYRHSTLKPLFIFGDFNHVTLDSSLSAFFEYVDCPTRGNKTIDLLYSNVRNTYTATPLPPLGKSDHNLVLLQPHYKPKLRREVTTTRSFRKWSPEAEEALRDCFQSIDWRMQQESYGEDIEGITSCINDYMNFCMDVLVHVVFISPVLSTPSSLCY